MENIMKYIILVLVILISQINIFANNPYKLKKQNRIIERILQKENSTTSLRRLHNKINRIDFSYSNLYEKMSKGQKIVVFFDPAHGKLKNGKWQGGAATNRLSCTNKPEEFYSIKISREMYKLLIKNPFIDVKSTPDFLEVLKGNSDTYKNIPFKTTIKMAKESNAFIIISEHLNNVSMKFKADGVINLPGLHITRNRYGKKFLTNTSIYSGFLTLYNKLDASGFSKNYAISLKDKLVARGLKANNWEFGAVGDDRFSYFTDFPVSIIYESGFISNPEEEKKLRDDTYISNLVQSQYDSLLSTIDKHFGINILKGKLLKTSASNWKRVELLKLSRIAIFYLKIGKTKKAVSVIKQMQIYFPGKTYKNEIKHYSKIKKDILFAEKRFKKYKRYRRSKRWRTRKKARKYLRVAKRIVRKKPLFSYYVKKYSQKKSKKSKYRKTKRRRLWINTKRKKSIYAKKSKYSKKIILPIVNGYSLKESIQLALNPSPAKLKRLLRSLKTAKKVTWHKKRKYSKKKKRRITYWKKRVRKIHFKKGIYIVSLSKNLYVKKAKRVKSIELNSSKYQNQQYLKNSFLSNREKNKSL